MPGENMRGEGQECLLTGLSSPDSALPTTLGAGVLTPNSCVRTESSNLPKGVMELAPRPNTWQLPHCLARTTQERASRPGGMASRTASKIVFSPLPPTRADFGTEKVTSNASISHYGVETLPLPACFWGPGKCSLFQNWCPGSECSAGSISSHSPASSILLSDFYLHSLL